MSMHMEGPWLSTTGKKKGKQKFKSAAEKRKAEQLKQEWEQLQKEWASLSPRKIPKGVEAYKPPAPYVRQTEKIPSLPFSAGPCTKAEQKVYTGTLIKGIGTMHKSNAVPILNDEDAKAIASMRR